MSSNLQTGKLYTVYDRQILQLGEGTGGVYLPVPWSWILRSFREGDDLVLQLSNGRLLVVENYFAEADVDEILLLTRSEDGGVDTLSVSSDGRAIEIRPIHLPGLDRALEGLGGRYGPFEEPEQSDWFGLREIGLGAAVLAGGSAAVGTSDAEESDLASPRAAPSGAPLPTVLVADLARGKLEQFEADSGVEIGYAYQKNVLKVLEAFADHPTLPLEDLTVEQVQSIVEAVQQHLHHGDEVREAAIGSLRIKIDRAANGLDGTVDREIFIDLDADNSLRQQTARYDDTPDFSDETDAENDPDWVETYIYNLQGQLVETRIDGSDGMPIDGTTDRRELDTNGDGTVDEVRTYRFREIGGSSVLESVEVDTDPFTAATVNYVETHIYGENGDGEIQRTETRIDGGSAGPLDGNVDLVIAYVDGSMDHAWEYDYRQVDGTVMLDRAKRYDAPADGVTEEGNVYFGPSYSPGNPDHVDIYAYLPNAPDQVLHIEHDSNGDGTPDGVTTYQRDSEGRLIVSTDRDGDGTAESRSYNTGGGYVEYNPEQGRYDVASGTVDFSVEYDGTQHQLVFRDDFDGTIDFTGEMANDFAGVRSIVLPSGGGSVTLIISNEGLRRLIPDSNGDGTKDDDFELRIIGGGDDTVVLEGPGLDATGRTVEEDGTDGVDGTVEKVKFEEYQGEHGKVFVEVTVRVADQHIDLVEESDKAKEANLARLLAQLDDATTELFALSGIAGVTGATLDNAKKILGAYDLFSVPERRDLTEEQVQALVNIAVGQLPADVIVETARTAKGRLMLSASSADGDSVSIQSIIIEQDASSLRAIRMTNYLDTDADGTIDEILVSEVDADGVRISGRERDSDANGSPETREEYEYDTLGRLVKTRYDDFFDGTASNFAENRVEAYSYGTNGRLSETAFDVDGDSTVDRIETYRYDASGRVVERSQDNDADGTADRSETYVYDDAGHLAGISYDDNSDGSADRSESLSYDSDGRVVARSIDHDANGSIDQFEALSYSAEGLLLQRSVDVDADSSAEQRETYRYDGHGRLVEVLFEVDRNDDGTADKGVSRLFDGEGRLTDLSYDGDGDGIYDEIEFYRFDAQGNLVETNYDFDADGRGEWVVRYERDSGQNIVRAEFDFDGDGTGERSATHIMDRRRFEIEEGRAPRSMLDVAEIAEGAIPVDDLNLGRMGAAILRSFSFAPQAQSVEYDDNQDGVTDRKEYFDHDAFGRLLEIQMDLDADGTVDRMESYSYNTGGQIGETRFLLGNDGEGEAYLVQRYQYDDSGRLSSIENDYDGDGSADEIRTFEYDDADKVRFGRVQRGIVHEQEPDGSGGFLDVVRFEYDVSLEYVRNDSGQIVRSQERDGDGLIFKEYEWDSQGRLVVERIDLGDLSAMPFPPMGPVQAPDSGGIPVEPVFEIVHQFEYDDEGRVSRRMDFALDPLSQTLSQVSVSDFEYDELGRLAKRIDTEQAAPGATVRVYLFDGERNLDFNSSIPDIRELAIVEDSVDSAGAAGSDGTADRLLFESTGAKTIAASKIDPNDIAAIQSVALSPVGLRNLIAETTFSVADDFLRNLALASQSEEDRTVTVAGGVDLEGTADDTLYFEGSGFRRQRYTDGSSDYFADLDGNRLIVEQESVLISTPFTRLVQEYAAEGSGRSLTRQQLEDAGVVVNSDGRAADAVKIIDAFIYSDANMDDASVMKMLEYSVNLALPQYVREFWALSDAQFATTTQLHTQASNVLVLDISESGDASTAGTKSVRITFGELDANPFPSSALFDLDFIGVHYDLYSLAEINDQNGPPAGFMNSLAWLYDLEETYTYFPDETMTIELRSVHGGAVGRLVDNLDSEGSAGSDGIMESLVLEADMTIDSYVAWRLAGIDSIDMDREVVGRPAQPEFQPGVTTTEVALDAGDDDSDGTPNFEELDSDGDGTPDYRESGDGFEFTRVVEIDTNNDGTIEGASAVYTWTGPYYPAVPAIPAFLEAAYALHLSDESLSILADGDDDGTPEAGYRLLIHGGAEDSVVLQGMTRETGLDETLSRIRDLHGEGIYHAYQGTDGVVLVESEISVETATASASHELLAALGPTTLFEHDTNGDGSVNQLERRTLSWTGRTLVAEFDDDYSGSYDAETFDADRIVRSVYTSDDQPLYSIIDSDGDGSWDRVVFESSGDPHFEMSVAQAAEWRGIEGITLAEGKTTFSITPDALVALNPGADGVYIDGNQGGAGESDPNPDVVQIPLGENGFALRPEQENGRDVFHYTAGGQEWKLLIDPDIVVVDASI